MAGARPAPKRINNNPIADARRLAASANSLAELRAMIQEFDGCPLKKAAKPTEANPSGGINTIDGPVHISNVKKVG